MKAAIPAETSAGSVHRSGRQAPTPSQATPDRTSGTLASGTVHPALWAIATMANGRAIPVPISHSGSSRRTASTSASAATSPATAAPSLAGSDVTNISGTSIPARA
jgi:hypothetical protein